MIPENEDEYYIEVVSSNNIEDAIINCIDFFRENCDSTHRFDDAIDRYHDFLESKKRIKLKKPRKKKLRKQPQADSKPDSKPNPKPDWYRKVYGAG